MPQCAALCHNMPHNCTAEKKADGQRTEQNEQKRSAAYIRRLKDSRLAFSGQKVGIFSSSGSGSSEIIIAGGWVPPALCMRYVFYCSVVLRPNSLANKPCLGAGSAVLSAVMCSWCSWSICLSFSASWACRASQWAFNSSRSRS